MPVGEEENINRQQTTSGPCKARYFGNTQQKPSLLETTTKGQIYYTQI